MKKIFTIKNEHPIQIQEFIRIYNDSSANSIPQFAKYLGVKIPLVRNILIGTNKKISNDLAYALSRVYGKSFEYWKTGEIPRKQEAVETYDLNTIVKKICEQVIEEKITAEYIDNLITERLSVGGLQTKLKSSQNLLDEQ